MMKNKLIIAFSFLLACLLILHAAPSMAMVLPFPMVQQQQTQWCWAASTKAIENYYGKTANQCEMATYLEQRNGWGNVDCCQYAPLSLPDFDDDCNQPNYFTYYPGNVHEIMITKYITPNNYLGGSLTQSEVQTEIYAGRPFEMAWAWQYQGGHALVGYGLNGDQVNYMDPGPWNPQANVASYSWIYKPSDNSHTWTETIKSAITPQPPIPDVKANGADGSIRVYRTTPVNVTISLNAGDFTNTQADGWVASYINGLWYYYFFDTSTSTWQWSTQAKPAKQGGLISHSPLSVFNGTVPAGVSITIYYGVDLTMDGVLDNPYYYDYVTITGY